MDPQMYSGSIDYTVCSTDPSRYSRINCNLTAPVTKNSALTVTCLTANCNIMILDRDDYITFNEDLVHFDDDYSNLNGDTLAAKLNDLLEPTIKAYTDEAGRLTFVSSKEFMLNDMSYNTKLITGFYDSTLPNRSSIDDSSGSFMIKAQSVGFMISTPVLYLISNVGMQSYRNMNEDLCGAKIVMRLNNSFTASYPIIVNNADFETILPSNDLSSLEFRLVDAYMHEIHLLSPMYLSIHIRAVDEERIPSAFELMYGRQMTQSDQK